MKSYSLEISGHEFGPFHIEEEDFVGFMENLLVELVDLFNDGEPIESLRLYPTWGELNLENVSIDFNKLKSLCFDKEEDFHFIPTFRVDELS